MNATPPDRDRDRGSVMPMTTILVTFLMIAAWSLASASQQWSTRRDVHAVAASAARAAAQGDPLALRSGTVLDPDAAVARAESIINASGYAGSVAIDGLSVTVTVTAPIQYSFPSPGFPSSVTGTASAVVQRGVNGQEGG